MNATHTARYIALVPVIANGRAREFKVELAHRPVEEWTDRAAVLAEIRAAAEAHVATFPAVALDLDGRRTEIRHKG